MNKFKQLIYKLGLLISTAFKENSEKNAITQKSEEERKKEAYKKEIYEEVEDILRRFSKSGLYIKNLLDINKLEKAGYICTEIQKDKKQNFLAARYLDTYAEELIESFEKNLTQNDWAAIISGFPFQRELQRIGENTSKNISNLVEKSESKLESLKQEIKTIRDERKQEGLKSSSLQIDDEKRSDRFRHLMNLEEQLDKAQRFPTLLLKLNNKEFAQEVIEYLEPKMKNEQKNMGVPYSALCSDLVEIIVGTHYSHNKTEELAFLIHLKKKGFLTDSYSLKRRLEELEKKPEVVKELSLIEKAEAAYKAPSILTDLKNNKKFEVGYLLEKRIKEIESKKEKYIKESKFPEERAKIESIVDVALKNAVTIYLEMDPALRDTMKNSEGKTAKMILEDTLTTLEQNISGVAQSIQEKRMNLLAKENAIVKKQLSLAQ